MDKKEVFISYHTNSSKEAVVQICDALESAGISCWYAPRDIMSGKDYADVILDAIDDCQVFLVVLNEQEKESKHLKNEMECAFERYNQEAKIVLLPFFMRDKTLYGSYRYYLKSIHGIDGKTPPFQERLEDLVGRVAYELGKQPEYTAVIHDVTRKKKAAVYSLIGSNIHASKDFVGRKTELMEIHRSLTGDENVLALVGMGGIGKSEIARAYIKQHKEDYDVVLWIPFDTSIEQTMGNDYIFPIQGIARDDYKEDTQREYFERKLEVWKRLGNRRVLLVMDNFDVTEDPDLEAFCSGEQTVLFTTRYEQSCNWLPEIKIREMTDKAELMELFQKEYKRKLSPEEQETVYEMIAFLCNHTLAVRQVASAMQTGRIAPARMFAMLQEGAVEMGRTNAKVKDKIFGSLEQIFKLASLTPDEDYIMRNLALISMQGIDVKELYEWCGMEDYEVIDGLIARNWIVHNPVSDSVHLHPLVVQLVLETMKNDGESCKKLLECLLKECKEIVHTSAERKMQLLDYANVAYDRLDHEHPLKKIALEAKVTIMKSRAMLLECIPYYEKMYEYTEELADKMQLLNLIAHCQTLAESHEEGLETALKACRLIDGRDPLTLSAAEGGNYCDLQIRVSECYRQLGKYEESVTYARNAVELSEHFYQSSPQEMKGWSRYHLAAVLLLMGDFDEAAELLEQAKGYFAEVDDNLSKGIADEVLSQIMTKQGKYEEAFRYVREAYDILLKTHGPYHMDIAVNYEQQGNIYCAMGDVTNAVYYYNKSAEVYRKCNLPKKEARVLEIRNSIL